jgi:hypothetical protein
MLVLLAAACGSNAPADSNAPASTTPPVAQSSTTPTAAPAPDLNAELLTISDLPAGWSVVPSSGGSSAAPRCLLHAQTGLKATSKAEATFADGSDGLPLLGEYLSYLPGQGQSAMAFLSRRLSSCGHISLTSDGQALTGTMGAMSFPAVADQSSAYQMNLSASVSGLSITLGIDLIVFRKADTVAMILYGDLGTPDIQAVQRIVRHAAAKLS